MLQQAITSYTCHLRVSDRNQLLISLFIMDIDQELAVGYRYRNVPM